jgi:nucleoid-associated protein YgaU
MPITRGNLLAAEIYEIDDETEVRKNGGIAVACMFNPYEYTVTKSNSYRENSQNRADVPDQEFTGAGAQELRLKLTFDTYETGQDVTLTTTRLWQLMEFRTREEGGQDDKIPPPRVAFEWGVFRFVAVITTMTQKFTMFRHDGTPVRATVEVTFKQDRDPNEEIMQNPTSGGGDVERVWRVTAGDRLDTIAYEVYGDATKWRLIAEHNHLVDPLRLRGGQQLSIPLA